MCVYLSQQLRDGLLYVVITMVGTVETLTFGRRLQAGLLLPTDDIIGVSDPGLYIEVRRRQLASVWPWRIGSLPFWVQKEAPSMQHDMIDPPRRLGTAGIILPSEVHVENAFHTLVVVHALEPDWRRWDADAFTYTVFWQWNLCQILVYLGDAPGALGFCSHAECI